MFAATGSTIQPNVELQGKDWTPKWHHISTDRAHYGETLAPMAKVKAWKEEKGFGFLIADDGTEVSQTHLCPCATWASLCWRTQVRPPKPAGGWTSCHV